MAPRNERSCFSVSGRLSACTAVTPSGVGDDPFCVILNPRNFTEFLKIWHLLNLIFKPAFKSVCSIGSRCWKCDSRLFEKMIKSSKYVRWYELPRWASISWNLRFHNAQPVRMPKGKRQNCQSPSGVRYASLCLSLGSTMRQKYASDISKVV